MGIIRRHPKCAAVFALLIVLGISAVVRQFLLSVPGKEAPVTAPVVSVQPEAESTAVAQVSEMRAVWVPYMSLSMVGQADQSQAAFCAKFTEIVQTAKAHAMNTLIVQVRPFGDAYYPSKLFPWSHLLTGTQGQDPGYDPLACMVEIAHENGLAIHAWVNPLRIQLNTNPAVLSENNPYVQWSADDSKQGWTVPYENGIYMNPAYEQVRKYIADGVAEIVQNYDVDGVQFDDYFYPTQSADFDSAEYERYCADAQKDGEPVDLLSWRQGNISAMVSQVYARVKQVKADVQFGISPQGNVQNCLNMGADVATWCSATGYLDYICPQLYVNFEHPVLPFDDAVSQWRALVTNAQIKLYFGLGLYKAGSDVDNGTWKAAGDILSREIIAGRAAGGDGFMFYAYDYLTALQTAEEVQNVLQVLQ